MNSRTLCKLGYGVYTDKPYFVDIVQQQGAKAVLLFENAIQLAPTLKVASPDILIIGRWWFDPVQYVPTNPAEAYHKGKEVATALDIPQPSTDRCLAVLQ